MEERSVLVRLPEYAWKYLDEESEDSGVPVAEIVRRIVARHVRSEKGNCG